MSLERFSGIRGGGALAASQSCLGAKTNEVSMRNYGNIEFLGNFVVEVCLLLEGGNQQFSESEMNFPMAK